MAKSDTKISKFLSLVLRHKPEEIGLNLDPEGWAIVAELIDKSPIELTEDDIVRVVQESDKRRFALSDDGLRIRANQGHSVQVDLGLEPVMPPDKLYHGTATRFLAGIKKNGLLTKSRQYVHLSLDEYTATQVGQRHGKPVVLIIRAGDMHQSGFQFHVSENGVWLTDSVPCEFIDFQAD